MDEIKSIKVVYSMLPPFVKINETENGETVLDGIMPEIFESLIKWMNLNATWEREPEDKYGTWENNTWTGMCGRLFRNEVDAILNPLLPSAEYAEVVHYTNPIMVEAFTFLSGKEKEEGDFFLYFSVLQPSVWASMVASLIAIAIASGLLFRRLSVNDSWTFSLGQYFWIYTTYTLRQAPSEKWMLRSNKKKIALLMPILIMFWLIGVSFLVMTVFQSLLVSKLTIVKSHPMVDSMSDMINRKDIRGITDPAIEIQEVLKDSGMPLYDNLWNKLESDMVSDDILTDKYIMTVEKGEIAIVHGHLVLENSLSDFFQKYGRCNLHLSHNQFFPFPLLIALRKSLPESFVRKFNEGLTRLTAGDITGKWFKPIFQTCRLCTSYSENDLKPLQVKNILGVIIIWCSGILVSIICFIMEICCVGHINTNQASLM